MKLANQYWTNMETVRASRAQQPIETRSPMKDERMGKYVPLSFYAHLLDMWHQFS